MRFVRGMLSGARDLSGARTFLVRDDAISTVEYAFMVALIALVCFTAVTLFGRNTGALFGNTTLLGVR
jgi:Flp pilus assembly pilin Flp